MSLTTIAKYFRRYIKSGHIKCATKSDIPSKMQQELLFTLFGCDITGLTLEAQIRTDYGFIQHHDNVHNAISQARDDPSVCNVTIYLSDQLFQYVRVTPTELIKAGIYDAKDSSTKYWAQRSGLGKLSKVWSHQDFIELFLQI